jgi:hypothetical protein
MMYARKTRNVLVPVQHAQRKKIDQIFVFIWRLLGGSFVQARVGLNTADWMRPVWKKKRVRMTANT